MDSQAVKHIAMQYIRDHSGLEQHRPYLGMSQIGRCPRLIYNWFFNGKGTPTDRAHLNCLSGYMYEAKVREILEGAGVAMVRYGPKSDHPPRELVAPFDARFVGHIDGETVDGQLLEIKSMDRDGFGVLVRTRQLPLPYYMQVQAYLRYGDYRRALVAVVERDAFDLWFVDVKRNEMAGEQIEWKAKQILGAIDAKDPAWLTCECGRCR